MCFEPGWNVYFDVMKIHEIVIFHAYRSGFQPKNNLNKHTSQRGKFYHYIQNTFLDSRSILRAIWDGPKSLFRHHKTQKMEIFKTLFFLNFGPVRPKQISSAHTFEIRKVHQKCSFLIFYNVWISLLVFDLNKLEFLSKGRTLLNLGEILASLL